MENGAKGVEVIISGKLRAQRAKAMKFRPGTTIFGKGIPNSWMVEKMENPNLEMISNGHLWLIYPHRCILYGI